MSNTGEEGDSLSVVDRAISLILCTVKISMTEQINQACEHKNHSFMRAVSCTKCQKVNRRA